MGSVSGKLMTLMIAALDAPWVAAADEKLQIILTPRLAMNAPEQNNLKSCTGCGKNTDITPNVSTAISSKKRRLKMILLITNSLGSR